MVMTDLGQAPLAEAVARYAKDKVTRFHMPGHKGGTGASPEALAILGRRAFELDITGVEGLDDLLQPTGVIREAEELLARAFGADASYFLINGTSSGLQALILGTVGSGEEIIVPRNMHKSMVSGVILSGARPVFVTPEVDREQGIALGVTPEKVEEALVAHPKAKAVLLISPTYYGVTSDLAAIAALVHKRGLPLLIDEAHGPHFYFHEDLPPGALRQGVDACAQGAHKILCSLTQSSWLHVKGERVDRGRLRAVLGVILSTSASYLLMASLDLARQQMVRDGRAILTRTLELAERLRNGVRRLPGLTTFGREYCSRAGAVDLDLTKVTVSVKGLGITGQQAELYLRYEHGIQVELSDLYNVLFIVGPGTTEEDVERLLKALAELVRENTARAVRQIGVDALPPIPRQVITPREAFFAPADTVPLVAAKGRISMETVTCYPPGIPILCPGEEVTPEIIEHIEFMKENGYRIQGPQDGGLTRLRVVKE
jgi:arginine decarboxylase